MATLTKLPKVDEAATQLVADTLERAAECGYKYIPADGVNDAGPLRKALAEKGIDIFTPASVEAYKREAAKKKNHKNPLWWLFLLVPIIGWFGVLPEVMADKWHWRRWEMQTYNIAIPLHVLNIMSDVHEYLKEQEIPHKFMVDVLTEDAIVDEDPFLCVVGKNGAECYYIAVWDEPRFEKNI